MANRLTAINYADTGDRTEFAYDGLGRRVKITEYGPGVTATVQPSGSSYSTFSTAPFTLPSGGYTLTFQGLNPNGGNNVALIDSVTLNGTLVANGSFESPSLTPPSFETDPTDTAWSYAGSSGIATNGSTLTSNNPNAPDGSQVAFAQNNGLLSQIWSVSAGTYTLSFKAAQSGSGNNSYEQVRVNVRPSGSVISAKTFVWSGNAIAEERDGTGATVTKRFFAEGEQRIGGSDAGNYYYTRDHLGSIREVTDSSGNLVGQYDYDAWGNEAVVNGNMTVDFGYTGHYFHQPSGLNFTLKRIYNPPLARWMSRDPLENAEMNQGPNLYAYVGNDPINDLDPLGLWGANEAYNDWLNIAANGLSRGGLLGDLQAAAGVAGMTAIDFWGARTLENNAERSGAAAGADCYGSAFKYGGLAVGQIGLAAGGQYALNTVLYPFFRFVGPLSEAGFGTGTWLTRAPLDGGIPYGSLANAASELQIPNEINQVVTAENVWWRYIAGPRPVAGNPQWGAGGGAEYRVGGFGP